MPLVYKYLASKVKTKFVCYLHITSPFLKDITLIKALKTFIRRKKYITQWLLQQKLKNIFGKIT